MDLTYLRILSVGGIFVVGVLTIVGAIVISLAVARVAEVGLAVGGWLVRLRTGRADVAGQATAASTGQAVGPGFESDAGTAHDLLARQARVRC